MRLFVAVNPGLDVLRRIEHLLTVLRPKAPSAKWVKTDSLPPDAGVPGSALRRTPRRSERPSGASRRRTPRSSCGSRAGTLGGRAGPEALGVGCDGDAAALNALHADVSSALAPLGYVPDHRDFNAHLTLARARDAAGDIGLSRVWRRCGPRTSGWPAWRRSFCTRVASRRPARTTRSSRARAWPEARTRASNGFDPFGVLS